MGTSSSKKTDEQKPYETDGVDLLPAYDLFLIKYDIENLVFGSAGAAGLAYAGAVKVLELVGVLRNVKRFAGVGTGALIAALLALNFGASDIYKYFNNHLESLALDEKEGLAYVSKGYYNHFGWNSGTKFLDWFAELLETKSYKSDISFLQLYQATNIELCILVTNIGTKTTVYCHPKTTPDMPISRALLMSLTVPGIRLPKKSKTQHKLCIDGGLICSYPIHVFDGWLLSMDTENSFLNKFGSAASKTYSDKFQPKNLKTLGFMFIDNHANNETELFDRLCSANAYIDIPSTTLGKKYEESRNHQLSTESDYFILRKACKRLFRLSEEISDDYGIICEVELANSMFKDSFPIEFRNKLLPASVRDEESCISYLGALRGDEPELYVDSIKDHFEKKARLILDSSSNADVDDKKGLAGFFSSMAKVYRKNSLKISKDDFNRTVGILSRYIGINDVNMELKDKHFLYTQGWNATVVLLRQFSNALKESDST